MKQLFTVLFYFLSFSFLATGQTNNCTYTVKGQVLDVETKQPIPFVSVKVKGAQNHIITDEQGVFLIKNLCTEDNTLIVSCFGYCDSVCEHHHQHEEAPHIYLTQKVSELESVIIQAQKSREEGSKSFSQTTLQKEEISENPTASLADVVAKQQGVTLVSTGVNVQLPVIHGLYGNRILILNNGLKHGFQNWGSDHAPEININAAHTITIVKGAAGVRYGPEALAGAIVVEPNPIHLQEPFYVNVGTDVQSNGRGGNMQAELGEGFRNWSYFLNGSYTKLGDRKAPDYNLTNTGKEEQSFDVGMQYHGENWNSKLYYSYVGQNLGLLRSSVADSGDAFKKAVSSERPTFIRPFSYDINQPNQEVQHHLVKAELNWWYADKGKLTLILGQQFNKRKEFDVRRNANLPIINLDLRTTDVQLEWKHPDIGLLKGMVGVQSFSQNNDNNPGTNTTPFIPNYNTNRYSAFLLEGISLGTHTLEAGLRLDYEYNNIRGRKIENVVFKDEYSFTNATASLGYIKKIGDNKSFRANLGTAWRVPNVAELYSFGQNRFKLSYGLLRYQEDDRFGVNTNNVIKMDTSNVEPEVGYKFTNEFHMHQQENTHTVTFYSHYIKNFVFEKPLGVLGTFSGPTPAFIYSQADSFFTGLDYTWEKDWSEQLCGTLGLSYLWSKNVIDNEPLINQPPLFVDYKLDWNMKDFWKFDSSKISIKPSYTFQQFNAPRTVSPDDLIEGIVPININSEIFDFKKAPKSYFLLDIAWRFSYKRIKGSIAANNVLNTSYRSYLNSLRYFADDLGRNFHIGLQYTFKE